MWANRSCSTNPLAEQNTLLSDTRAPQLEQEQRGKRETCPLRKKEKQTQLDLIAKKGRLARTSLAHRSQTLERPRRREGRNNKGLKLYSTHAKGRLLASWLSARGDFLTFSGFFFLGFRSIIRPWIRLFNQLLCALARRGRPSFWRHISRVPAC